MFIFFAFVQSWLQTVSRTLFWQNTWWTKLKINLNNSCFYRYRNNIVIANSWGHNNCVAKIWYCDSPYYKNKFFCNDLSHVVIKHLRYIWRQGILQFNSSVLLSSVLISIYYTGNSIFFCSIKKDLISANIGKYVGYISQTLVFWTIFIT